MPSITLTRISNHICRNTSLSVQDGELLVLVGATGAGKTTILNVIAGLSAYKGQVVFGDNPVDNLPPAKRNVGYLFQEFALFPHLRVRENIAFGLHARGVPQKTIVERVDTLLRLLNIRHIASRYPGALSGGEKQRVALARTLAPGPEILLLDEPFSNLDPRTAKFLRLELKRLHTQLGLTAVYVTHNQMEAFEMGDRMAVVHQGQIEQIGKPLDILFSPQSSAVSHLFGSPNILTCDRVETLDFGLSRATCGALSLIVPDKGGKTKKIAVLPSGVRISQYPIETPEPNRFSGKILAVHQKSPIVVIDIQIEATVLSVELPGYLWDEMNLQVSEPVHVAIPLKWIRVLPA